ncbi:MAG TPA: molybdopterin cofactor-binding domain-containing protein, partial [Lacipirellulaceae bacterium]
MVKQSLKFVGQSVPRVDGIEKVTGQAKFLGDLAVPGMLHGKVVRSSYPHARIVSIDASKAEALEGVAAVLTNADISDLNAIYSGRPVIAMNKVRYVGEPVAAVAAVDQATAEQAAALIEVQYEELPAAIGIDRARAPGAALIHEGRSDNICSHESVVRGDVHEAFAQSHLVLEDQFTFPMVYHYAMEPHAVIAHWNEDGVTVWSSAQHPFQVRGDIGKVFRLPTSRVRMVISYLGGGY